MSEIVLHIKHWGNNLVWIDCNPQAGRGMRDIHPFLVLSSKAFNEHTSMVIGVVRRWYCIAMSELRATSFCSSSLGVRLPVGLAGATWESPSSSSRTPVVLWPEAVHSKRMCCSNTP